MFFCKGKGIFSLLFLFASILITTSFTYFILQVENDFSRSKWFLFATSNLAGFFCWTIGKLINSKSPKIFIDPKTNQAVQLVDSKKTYLLLYSSKVLGNYLFPDRCICTDQR